MIFIFLIYVTFGVNFRCHWSRSQTCHSSPADLCGQARASSSFRWGVKWCYLVCWAPDLMEDSPLPGGQKYCRAPDQRRILHSISESAFSLCWASWSWSKKYKYLLSTVLHLYNYRDIKSNTWITQNQTPRAYWVCKDLKIFYYD